MISPFIEHMAQYLGRIRAIEALVSSHLKYINAMTKFRLDDAVLIDQYIGEEMESKRNEEYQIVNYWNRSKNDIMVDEKRLTLLNNFNVLRCKMEEERKMLYKNYEDNKHRLFPCLNAITDIMVLRPKHNTVYKLKDYGFNIHDISEFTNELNDHEGFVKLINRNSPNYVTKELQTFVLPKNVIYILS